MLSSSLRLAALLASLLSLLALPAYAGEGSLGWVYTLDLQPKGTLEFEQRLQINQGQAKGHYDLWQARTEVEYGVSEDFQIAGYLNTSRVNANQNYGDGSTSGWLVPSSAGSSPYSRTRVDGVSLEGIWRFTNPVIDPVGVGFYLEATTGAVKDELESRLLLQSNFLDDRLVVAANLQLSVERVKFNTPDIGKESMADLLLGMSYRVANNWTAGMEYRFHNDFEGYSFNQQTQRAHFIGPNMHYATKDWWVTAAWRYQLKGQSHCWAPGEAECSNGRVWDSHSRNEVMFKFGRPL
jgi:opacity protein-like surface antigen